jgi:hypothetical protein
VTTEAPEESLSLRTLLRDHPIVTAVLVGCTVLGAILGGVFLSSDWHLARRLAGGAVAGTGIGLLITFNRLYGAE